MVQIQNSNKKLQNSDINSENKLLKRKRNNTIDCIVPIIIIFIIFILILLKLGSEDYSYIDNPSVNGVLYQNDDYYIIKFKNVNPSVPASTIEYLVIDDDNGETVEDLCDYGGLDDDGICKGSFYEIYCVNLLFQNEEKKNFGNVSFIDKNRDGKLSANDTLWIRKENNQDSFNLKGNITHGPGRTGLILIIKFRNTGDTLFTIKFEESQIYSDKIPFKHKKTTMIDGLNYNNTFDLDIIFSNDVVMRGGFYDREVKIGISLKNNFSKNFSCIVIKINENTYNESEIISENRIYNLSINQTKTTTFTWKIKKNLSVRTHTLKIYLDTHDENIGNNNLVCRVKIMVVEYL